VQYAPRDLQFGLEELRLAKSAHPVARSLRLLCFASTGHRQVLAADAAAGRVAAAAYVGILAYFCACLASGTQSRFLHADGR